MYILLYYIYYTIYILNIYVSNETLFCFCFKLILSIGRLKLLLNFVILVRSKRVHLIRDYSLFNLLFKKGFVGKITYNLHFFMGRKAFFIFFHMKKNILQNYKLLFHISLWRQSLAGALQK